MLKISARKLLTLSPAIVWENLNGDFICVFDDGEMAVNEKDIYISSFFWEFHRKYPMAQLKMSHCARYHIKDGAITSKTHASICEEILFDVYDTYVSAVPNKAQLMQDLAKLYYRTSNWWYNESTLSMEEYVSSYDILDFLAVSRHPEIVYALETTPHTQEGIDSIYSLTKGLMKKDPVLSANRMVRAINAGVVKMDQSLQCLVLRGYLTDINSMIFPQPIWRSFTSGIRQISDYMQESRSAAKALANSEQPLQKSEYFSRRVQHIASQVERLHPGDCGSQKYVSWLMRDAQYVDGIKVQESDLLTLVGKYYLDEEMNTLRSIRSGDKHLLGKVLKIRSVMAGCNHTDVGGICEICYGKIAETIPENTNIGIYSAVNMMEKISQKVISTKHYDGSSVIEGLFLEGLVAKYLWAPRNGSDYYLNISTLTRNKNISLKFKQTDVEGITDITIIDDVRKLNLSRVSEFESVTLELTDEDGIINTVVLNLELNARKPNMTHDLLKHVKENGFTVNNDGTFVIPLNGWDCKKPLFCLPMRHFNMGDHQSAIEQFLSGEDSGFDDDGEGGSSDSGKKNSRKQKFIQEDTPLDVMLVKFHDLVNKKIMVGLASLEIVLYAHLIANAEKKDYRIPKSWDTPIKGKMSQMYENRSYGVLMAYQGHRAALTSPAQYLHTNRVDSPFDWILMPSEVYNHYNGKRA